MKKHVPSYPVRAVIALLTLFCLAGRTAGFCQEDCCAGPAQAGVTGPDEIFAVFSKAADCFFKDNKFNEACACFTQAGEQKKSATAVADYFCALARYRQLTYLEEQQIWEEYFSKGTEYRDQITQGLVRAVKASSASEPVAVYANLLAWRYHKDQEDSFTGAALADLMAAIDAYGAKTASPGPIKEAADALAAYGEKAKARQAYALYINAVLASSIDLPVLKAMGDTFFKEQNLELAEGIYDAYIKKLTQQGQKDALIAELASFARQFSFKDEGLKDALYAEQIFQKLEAAGGTQALSEELLFLRAYNLEKYKDFISAKNVYAYLLKTYPQTKQADRIALKVALFSAYAANDAAGARQYLTKLADKEPANAESVASLYHLGLLSQWEDDLEKARGYYTTLLQKAGSAFAQTAALAKTRLKEIDQKQLLDNRLRLFLDAALGQESSLFTMSRSELRASAYRLTKGQEVEIRAAAYPPQSGCLEVSLEYLWLGDVGTASPSVEDASFKTSFEEPGVKMIGVVVTMPSGMLDRAIDFLDVD